MIIDPYLDEKFLFEYAPFVKEGVKIKLLTVNAHKRVGLAPALRHWRQQHQGRQVNIRSTSSNRLHDRAIIVDGQRVWTVGQSFNAMAARAPTSFVEADPETAKLKIDAHAAMWEEGDEINP